MSGQCFGCGTEFGVFKKEHGCKNCGFAFCTKCLNDKSIPVPKRNYTKHHVCQNCYKILTGAAPQSTQNQNYDLPEAYLKRMAALKEREAAGHSSHSTQPSGGTTVIPGHLSRLDKADREIALRLEKLKTDGKPTEKVLDSDVHARLAKLKGQTHVPEQKPVYKPPDRRPEVHQVDDLIEQLKAEVDIDSHRPDPVQDIEARLAKFQQADGTKPVVDIINNINLNGKDKGATDGNDLNKMDKMGAMGRLSNHGGRNIQINKGETSASGAEEIDLLEMQRLMLQAAKEVELDAQRAVKGLQQDKGLMSRLKEFQKQRKGKRSTDSETVDSDADNTIQTGNTTCSDDENDDLAAKRIIQQLVDEVNIDDAVGKSRKRTQLPKSSGTKKKDSKGKRKAKSSPISAEEKPSNLESPLKEDLDSDYDDTDELPYCCICTEDATIRCKDCDMDLYCQRCFRGCHQEMEITDHRTIPYKAPKGYR